MLRMTLRNLYSNSDPLRCLPDALSLPWAQASGWWLCCSHAETFLFTAVFPEGGSPGATVRSVRPAELWSGDTEFGWSSDGISGFRFDSIITKSPFLSASPPAAQWHSAVSRPLWM